MAGRNRNRDRFAPHSLVKAGVKTGDMCIPDMCIPDMCTSDMCISPAAAEVLRSFDSRSVELEE